MEYNKKVYLGDKKRFELSKSTHGESVTIEARTWDNKGVEMVHLSKEEFETILKMWNEKEDAQ